MAALPSLKSSLNSDVINKQNGTLQIIEEMCYDFIYGSISAAISKTTVAPIERLKLLLQTRFINDYNDNLVKITRNIIKEQGIISFWRGNFPNIIRYFPLQAFMLSFKEQFKLIFVPKSENASTISIICGNIISGGIAGCCAITLIYPLDLTRTRLAVDMGSNMGSNMASSNREFKGIIDCLSKTYKTGGILSWYQGLSASYCCYFIYRGLQIGGYDAAKRIYNIDLKKNMDSTILGYSFLLSYGISCGSMTISYPFDTIRRKMMMQAGIHKELRQYNTMYHCFHDIISKNGTKGLYRGLFVNYFRAFGSSLVLVLFDLFKTL